MFNDDKTVQKSFSEVDIATNFKHQRLMSTQHDHSKNLNNALHDLDN